MRFKAIKRLPMVVEQLTTDDMWTDDGVKYWSFKNGKCNCTDQLHSQGSHIQFTNHQCLKGYDEPVGTTAECTICLYRTPAFTGLTVQELTQHYSPYLELIELQDERSTEDLEPVYKLEEVKMGPTLCTVSKQLGFKESMRYYGFNEVVVVEEDSFQGIMT